MAALNLEQYGITGATEIIYNPSYEFLYEEEMKPGLEGYEKGQLTELDAVNVMTGIYTGRSPKTNTLSWMKIPKTRYGGRRPSTPTITMS